MKRRYKLMLIIIIGVVLTIIINNNHKHKLNNIMSIGDSISVGIIKNNIIGTSYGDYVSAEFSKNKTLGIYNYDFSLNGLTTSELLNYLNDNSYGSRSRIKIKQIISKSNVILLSIGMDELYNNLRNDKKITKYLNNLNIILEEIRKCSSKKIIMTGLYTNNIKDMEYVLEINKNIQRICHKYNIHFVDIIDFSISDKYLYEASKYYLNHEGQYIISEIICKILNKCS